jgi:serine/threonine protein phosphatase PrpC
VTLAVRFAARSHAGLLRALNEDSVYAGPRLLAVADGMGGHAAGEVASAVAIASLAPLDEDAPPSDLLAALKGAADSANAHLRDMVSADADLSGMGTTLVALLFAGTRLGLLHVGDSRCYLLRDGVLTQITHDHTLVQALIDAGRITEEEASNHPQRSVITRVLDGRDDVEFDLSVRETASGDRFLLCSDGLTGPVASLDTLTEALSLPDPQDSVDRLVQLALRGGGPDNITVIVADIVDQDISPAQPVVAGAAAETPQEAPPGVADSAASRARVAEGRDHVEASRTAAVAPRSRPHSRTLLALLLLLLVLAGITVGGWRYVRSQYYVGLDGSVVVVFQGVHGSLAGVAFHTVAERTALTTADLSELESDRFADGITATSRRDAERIVQRLIAATACASSGPTAAPQASPTTPASPAPRSAVVCP